MKVRIKFAKQGAMKFIGHLDIMRYFQKAVKRAGLDAAYSEGFSPHMIMSFAAPLGVGVTSEGEYFDLELKTPMPSKEAVERLNQVMVEGMEVLSVREVPEGKKGKAMSLVAAADYLVSFREGMEPGENWKEKVPAFMEQQEIRILKKTKKNEKEVDIKPYIYGHALPQRQELIQYIISFCCCQVLFSNFFRSFSAPKVQFQNSHPAARRSRSELLYDIMSSSFCQEAFLFSFFEPSG